jgi:hypothetical protein
MDTFKRKYEEALKYATIDAVFRDPDSEDCKEVLLEFMQQEFDEHELPFQKCLYLWAMEHMNDCAHLTAWRKACKLSHELNVQYSDAQVLNTQMGIQINPLTIPLCRNNNVLAAARHIWLSAQQAAQQSSSSTAIRVRVSTLSPG